MTATIQDVGGYSTTTNSPLASLPIAAGDRLSWTLRYDRASPVYAPESDAHENYYFPGPGPLITNLVDRSNGFHLATFNTGAPFHLELLNYGGGFVGIEQGSNGMSETPYFMQLNLRSNRPLPTLNLADLRLDQAAFQLNDNSTPAFDQFRYNGLLPNTQNMIYFDAQLNSLSPGPTTPEPASLTLLALGFVGLAVRRFRRPL